MAPLRERQVYRERVLTALYEATEGNRLPGVPGRKLPTHPRWSPSPTRESGAWRPRKENAAEPDRPRTGPQSCNWTWIEHSHVRRSERAALAE